MAQDSHAAVAARRAFLTSQELLAQGQTPERVRARLQTGELRRVHRGVYRLREVPSTADDLVERSVGALLAAGEGAAMSHAWAGALRGVVPAPAGPPTVRLPPGRQLRRRADLCPYRSTRPVHVEFVRGVPTTGLTRTLVDLGTTHRVAVLVVALARTEALGALDARRIIEEATELVGTPGLGALRIALEIVRCCGPVVRSMLEAELLVLCHRSGLPLPAANARVETPEGWFEVDALWVDRRVVVETDGFETHGDIGVQAGAVRSAFERDRARWAAIEAAGYRVLVFTWRQVMHRSEVVAGHIRATLALPVGGDASTRSRHVRP